MRHLTSRKRAAGMGASGTGTQRHWSMMVSSIGLLVLLPAFIFTVGPMIGEPHARVVSHFAQPFPAIVSALTIWVGFSHFRTGAQTMIEDYTRGMARKVTIIAVTCLSYAAAFTGIYAIARMAL